MKDNILLIGMPGCGKTVIGKILAKKMHKNFIDVDEFIFEVTGKDSAEHLNKLGDERFLDFESEIVQKINKQNTIIASSGSVPLREKGLKHLQKNAITIWIDVPLSLIKKRIKNRSDGSTRIVGAQTTIFEEILNWRHKKYAKNHDIHYKLKEEISAKTNTEEILKLVNLK